MKLKYKLLFFMLFISLTVVTVVFYISKATFRYQFLNYLEKRELKRITKVADAISENFSHEKDLLFLAEDPVILFRIARDSFDPEMDRKREHRPYHRGHQRGFGPPHRRFKMGFGKKLPIVILGKDDSVLFGMKNDNLKMIKIPIKLSGKTAGWIGFYPERHIRRDDEKRFLYNQSRTFMIIICGMVLISIIVAVWAAYFLEKPIKIVAEGTRKLSSGDFKIRLDEESKDELGDLARNFNFLARTLEKNDEDRKRWVADIAHELRTPLTLLSGELEAVEDGIRPLNSETVKLLQSDIDLLIRLVSDLNELSKTDLGSVSYKKRKIDPSLILKRSVEKFADNFRSKDFKVNFISGNGDTIFGDPERIEQLFGNLLKNSFIYTDEGGKIKIQSKIKEKNMVVSIEDSAPSVDEEDLSRLFDRLYRVESSRNREFGGSGLGLAICRNIVTAHGGTIEAYKSDLGGLKIEIKIPVN